MSERTHSAPPLRRELNFSSLVALTFFCVAGGAYGLEDAVGAAGPLIVLLGILILPWLWSFPTALMTAELSTAMPEDGGYVVWVNRAFGKFWGFQEGWLSWLCSFADNALYPVMFVDYLSYLRGDMDPLERWLIGVALIGTMTWLNVRGIRLVGFASVLFSFVVLAPFAVMVIAGAPQVDPASWLARTGTIDWALLLSILLWNTSGWDNAGCCAAEVREPARVYPRAMIATVLLVTLVYLLPLAVGAGVATDWTQWKEGYLPQIAAQIGGPSLGGWLTFAALISAAGMLNALLCTSARVPYAMAERGLLPHALCRLHPRYATPWVAILVNSIGVSLLLPFSFQDLIAIDMFLYAAALILEFAALVWLRIKAPDLPRPFRVPFGIAGVIALSLPPVALCLVSIALSNDATKYTSLAGIALGLLIYRWQTRPSVATEIEPAPTL
ncbi:MAG TPA: APC family permease [Candidatus Binatia bacterium]|nr:APC family permease [Candidatus Binatia bacterium]